MTSTDWRGRLDENTMTHPSTKTVPRPPGSTRAVGCVAASCTDDGRAAGRRGGAGKRCPPECSAPGAARHRHGIPPITQTGSTRELLIIIAALVCGRRRPGHQPDVLPAPVRPDRPDGVTRTCCAAGCFGISAVSTSRSTTATRRAGSSAGPPMTSTPSRRCWRPDSTA